jgi:hypothetical protein
MLSFGGPAGPLRNGKIESTEIVRLVMSFQTLAQTVAVLNQALRELEATTQQTRQVAPVEGRSFGRAEPSNTSSAGDQNVTDLFAHIPRAWN